MRIQSNNVGKHKQNILLTNTTKQKSYSTIRDKPPVGTWGIK